MARLEYERVIKYIRHNSVKKKNMIRAVIVAAFVAVVILIGCGGTYIYHQVFGMEEVNADPGTTQEVEIALLDETNSMKPSADASQSEASQSDASRAETASGSGEKDSTAGDGTDSSLKATEETQESAASDKKTEEDAAESKAESTAESKTEASEEDGPPEVLVKSNADRTKQRDGFLVVVDAGHGGNDVGANSGEIYEKNINLNVATQAAALLEEQGVQVVLTRDTDKYLSLEKRVEISNEEEPDLFISFHCNTYPADSSVHGMDCYFAVNRSDSAFYAEHIVEVIKSHGDVRSRGTKAEDFYVIKYNHWPAVLVEMGFLTNPDELGKLNSADYQTLLAEQLTEGIMKGLEASR